MNTEFAPHQHSSFDEVPAEVKKWNWGAFFLGWIWGIGNSVWISLLTLIPVVNIVMMFVLGAKGSEWAWKAKQWESVAHFKRVQRIWGWVGFAIFIVGIIFGFIYLAAVIALISQMPQQPTGY
ncbi:ribonuclease G [Paenactinomyces guangxiensis]|uniref:Ribonuclease G n=1 Tax=Paenactinomyces guangxiensis TaxID=1490290 RepID=A0A7W1WND0_9BACL|nr:ribonuclease G [Paenactinomyces guangxiensis]MBA4493071.1 ribonuclease G [Paenactinomyces guangxiensis]MBH8590079.1 ribonuclease G [Paenactinomyces guangxiensis]